ncbi:PLP-dependent transferase [Alphaproteobacteria bacterium]|nr:PLP-dependent transferase [Alphaproteobacteria bacterium]
MSKINNLKDDEDLFIADILSKNKTIAMVGASKNWKRPSNFVMKYLQKHAYKVVPINPGNAGQYILNELCYASLEEVPFKIDMVNIFRPSKFCLSITKDAIRIGAKTVWMQLGIKNEEAIRLGKKANINVIYDKCPKMEHSKLSGALGLAGFNSNLISSKRPNIKIPPLASRNGGFVKSNELETLAIHAGTRPDAATGSRSVPIYQTTSFIFDDTDHAASLFNLQEPGNIYGRLSNPTISALEQRIAALDNGLGACCAASGHAAQMLALFPLMEPGTKIVASSKLYGGSITQFTKTFKNFSWDAELVDVSDLNAVQSAVQDNSVRVLFAESLANPDGNITDISSLAEIAHEAGIPLVIDNTMATQILCQPGKFGADLIIYSTTKFLSGHGNAMGGAVVDMGKFPWDKGRDYSKLTLPNSSYNDINFYESFGSHAFINYCHACVLRDLGATMAPLNAYLTLIGLETLPLRMKQHMKNAKIVANFLKSHSKVNYVSWAGFKENIHHELAKKYFKNGFGSVFTFSVTSGYEGAIKLVENCNLISHLTNVGDTRSLIVHPASTTHRQLTIEQKEKSGISDSIIRLSIGLESYKDIISDLDGALSTI